MSSLKLEAKLEPATETETQTQTQTQTAEPELATALSPRGLNTFAAPSLQLELNELVRLVSRKWLPVETLANLNLARISKAPPLSLSIHLDLSEALAEPQRDINERLCGQRLAIILWPQPDRRRPILINTRSPFAYALGL